MPISRSKDVKIMVGVCMCWANPSMDGNKKLNTTHTNTITCGRCTTRQAAVQPLFDTGGQAFRGGEEPGFSNLVAGGRLIGTSAQTSEYSAFSK